MATSGHQASEQQLKGQLFPSDASSDPPNLPVQNGDHTRTELGMLDVNESGAMWSEKKSPSQSASDDDDEEDYDKQEISEDTIVQRNRSDASNHTARRRPLMRRSSIPVKLEKTPQKGRYLLTLADAEIQEILQSIQNRNEGSSRSRLRDLVLTRRFTTFDRQSPSNADSPFRGFFVLFWLCMALMFLRIAAQNWRNYGSVLGTNELMQMMFARDVVVLGLTDAVMCAATAFGWLLQLLVCRGVVSWNRSGWIIQNLWQTFYLSAVLAWTMYRDWPWTHTIFVVLHALVFLMKQHSYAFYNGYLSQVYRRKVLLESQLKRLQVMSPLPTPIAQPNNSPFTSATEDNRNHENLKQRTTEKRPANLSIESSEVASVAATITSGEPLNPDQLQAFYHILTDEISALDKELQGKCDVTKNYYPHNLTLSNFADWTLLPTLVYELEYPRQDHTNWWYVLEKTLATFGGIGVMMVVSQAYIYPQVVETVRMKEAGMPLPQRWAEFPWIVSDLLFPLLLEQLLTWYVIWECVLNVLAEVTGFADRGFYGDWWNSTSWDQYARDWNRPVHNFLLRHVYHSSISAFKLSKTSATFVTFFLSACVHELLMYCLFKKVRGYLFTMQLLQIPLAMLSRTKLMRGRNLVGNITFWIGLFVGPSVLMSLYLIV